MAGKKRSLALPTRITSILNTPLSTLEVVLKLYGGNHTKLQYYLVRQALLRLQKAQIINKENKYRGLWSLVKIKE